VALEEICGVQERKNVELVAVGTNHAQHEHSTTPKEADGTKCLKMLIGGIIV
jgi:hypothetical protein